MMRFNVGESVEFELSAKGSKNRPRWEHGPDGGSTGIWVTGVVKKIDPYKIEVHYTIQGHVGTGICEWPNMLHPDYQSAQWLRPGFLRRKPKPKCECGGEKARTTHSLWCPVNTTGRK